MSLPIGIISLINTFSTYLPYPLIHITGENQSGKSLFIKNYIYSLLSLSNQKSSPTQLKLDTQRNPPHFFILETENKFSSHTFKNMFPSSYLSFIHYSSPRNLKDLKRILFLLFHNHIALHNGDFLIIDSISELLKNSFSKVDSHKELREEIKLFRETLWPLLISLPIKKKIHLILVHQVSYNPTYEKNIPYYYFLFRDRETLWIELIRTPHSQNFSLASLKQEGYHLIDLSHRFSFKTIPETQNEEEASPNTDPFTTHYSLVLNIHLKKILMDPEQGPFPFITQVKSLYHIKPNGFFAFYPRAGIKSNIPFSRIS